MKLEDLDQLAMPEGGLLVLRARCTLTVEQMEHMKEAFKGAPCKVLVVPSPMFDVFAVWPEQPVVSVDQFVDPLDAAEKEADHRADIERAYADGSTIMVQVDKTGQWLGIHRVRCPYPIDFTKHNYRRVTQ